MCKASILDVITAPKKDQKVPKTEGIGAGGSETGGRWVENFYFGSNRKESAREKREESGRPSEIEDKNERMEIMFKKGGKGEKHGNGGY